LQKREEEKGGELFLTYIPKGEGEKHVSTPKQAQLEKGKKNSSQRSGKGETPNTTGKKLSWIFPEEGWRKRSHFFRFKGESL